MELFPTRVLVAVDQGPSSRTAIDAARAICAATSSELWLVHVRLLRSSVSGKPVAHGQYDKLEREGQELLDELQKDLGGDGGVPVAQSSVRLGKSVEKSVAGFAEEIEAGLIVVGGTRHGVVSRTVGGDIAVGLVKAAPCSVLVVPPHIADMAAPTASSDGA
jgi:nucleotide-binding universal stress UspA family protein